jgi:hypothetical protein
MDSAYDTGAIREHSLSLGHVPIIEPQKHGDNTKVAPHERKRYAERCTIERVFSRLKDEFGAGL